MTAEFVSKLYKEGIKLKILTHILTVFFFRLRFLYVFGFTQHSASYASKCFLIFISQSLLRHCKNGDIVGKLVTFPMVKKISDFYITRKLLQTHQNVATGQYPNPDGFSSQDYMQFLKKHFNIILPLTPRSLKQSAFFKFSR